jgi:hypothetical protein
VIGRVLRRGSNVAGLLRYLFGPGRAEEHVNPRLVGAWEGAGPLADLQPPRRPDGTHDLRKLVALLLQPVRAAPRAPNKYVWHTTMRLAPVDRHKVFSDATWGHMVREMLVEARIIRPGGDAGIRFLTVRHADDHIHIVATTVREDGRIDWMKRDGPRVAAATAKIAARFGLYVSAKPDRTAHRRPSHEEIHKARRQGRPRTDRDELRAQIRTAAAAAGDEDDFFDRLRRAGVLVKLRDSVENPGQVTGYAVALPAGDGSAAPVFFSGGKLASDLTLPKLRDRWRTPTPFTRRGSPSAGRAERVSTMRQAAAAARAAAAQMSAALGRDPHAAQAIADAAADTLRTLAASIEGGRGGPFTDAAEAFDRAARAGAGPRPRPTPGSHHLRAMARLISLLGRVTGDDDMMAALKLVLRIAALGETLAQLREAQDRLHQAEAARHAATLLRAAAANAQAAPAAASTTRPTHVGGPVRTRYHTHPPTRQGGPS